MDLIMCTLAGAVAAGVAAVKNPGWMKTKKGKIGLGLIAVGTLAGSAVGMVAGAFVGVVGGLLLSSGLSLAWTGFGVGAITGYAAGGASAAVLSYSGVKHHLDAGPALSPPVVPPSSAPVAPAP